MITDDMLKTIRSECDSVLAKCNFNPVREEINEPFAASIYYKNVHSPRFQIQISAEADIVTKSFDFGMCIMDTETQAYTFPRAVVEAVFDDDSFVRGYGIATARIIYQIYGCRLFSEETLADPRIPWFRPPPPIPIKRV